MIPQRPSGRLAGLCVLVLGAICLRYWPLRGEDFIYYYCAGRTAASGRSPYEAGPYQACMTQVLGSPNPNDSKDAASVYPPPAVFLFRAFALVPYGRAYELWNAALLSASAFLAAAASAEPAVWLLLLTSPGFISGWAYHKLTVVLLLAFLAGLRLIDRGRHGLGGGLLGVLCVQPQWLGAAALYLAAQRRWRALGALTAASLLLFALAPIDLLSQWMTSVSFHSNNFIGFDNQSLFIALFKPIHAFMSVDARWFKAARGAASFALALLAWRCAAKKNKESLGLFLGLVLLAQPYSHVSDLVWAFPLFMLALERFESRLRWTRPRAVAAGLLVNGTLFLVAGGFAPGRLNRPGDKDRQGYFACALAGLYALSLAGRRSRVS